MKRQSTSQNAGSLKLGKGVAFVKTKLRRLSQTEDVWEADFQLCPDKEGWFGLVVSKASDFVLADLMIEHDPTVNDLADLLAKAMNRPMGDDAHRPSRIVLRKFLVWTELQRHLEELGIETVQQDHLPRVEEELTIFFDEFYCKSPK